MTPTPDQNAKRETPTQHEISDANRSTGKSCGCHYGGFICTRTPGHDGLHVASNGTKAVKSWPVETSVVDPEKRIADLETELQQLRLAADGMREEVEKAPHGENCMAVLDDPEFGYYRPENCNCWKSKALAAYRAAGEGSPKDTGTSRE